MQWTSTSCFCEKRLSEFASALLHGFKMNIEEGQADQDAVAHQQVMSAQGQAPLPNGTGMMNNPDLPSGSRGLRSMESVATTSGVDETAPGATTLRQPADFAGGTGGAAQGGIVPARPMDILEAGSVPQQAEPARAETTEEAARRLELEDAARDRAQESAQVDFMTPRSATSTVGPPTWLTALELPWWMSRMSTYLGAPTGDPTAPSPLAGNNLSPPGGRAFVLRSPVRQRRLARPPTPPSSSSIPAEAIQAEVERQMSGLLSRLQESEDRNRELSNQLAEARAETRAATSAS